jgi:hypothetical protein
MCACPSLFLSTVPDCPAANSNTALFPSGESGNPLPVLHLRESVIQLLSFIRLKTFLLFLVGWMFLSWKGLEFCFFSVNWKVHVALSFILLIWCAAVWFSHVDPALYSWDSPHLVLVLNPLYATGFGIYLFFLFMILELCTQDLVLAR